MHIFDICDGAEFTEFLGQTIAGWCRSSGLGFAFTLDDTDMAGNIICHSSKTVSRRAHHQPAGSEASLQWAAKSRGVPGYFPPISVPTAAPLTLSPAVFRKLSLQ